MKLIDNQNSHSSSLFFSKNHKSIFKIFMHLTAYTYLFLKVIALNCNNFIFLKASFAQWCY